MANQNLVSIHTRAQTQFKKIIVEAEPVFPSSWFVNNTSKPKITLQIETHTTDSQASKLLATYRNTIFKSTGDNVLQQDNVLNYLYLYLRTQTVTLTEEWRSYNRLIGSPNDVISPMNLLDVTTRTGSGNHQVGVVLTPNDDIWLVMFCLSVYRITRATNLAHKERIETTIKTLARAYTDEQRTNVLTLMATNMAGIVTNPTFQKIVAAVDMFYYKFPNEATSTLRVGTMGSRYRDCASLLSLQHVSKLLGKKYIGDLADFVFAESLAKELDFMFGTREEMDQTDSYFPYQVDFGLTTKSPYSAAVNDACSNHVGVTNYVDITTYIIYFVFNVFNYFIN